MHTYLIMEEAPIHDLTGTTPWRISSRALNDAQWKQYSSFFLSVKFSERKKKKKQEQIIFCESNKPGIKNSPEYDHLLGNCKCSRFIIPQEQSRPTCWVDQISSSSRNCLRAILVSVKFAGFRSCVCLFQFEQKNFNVFFDENRDFESRLASVLRLSHVGSRPADWFTTSVSDDGQQFGWKFERGIFLLRPDWRGDRADVVGQLSYISSIKEISAWNEKNKKIKINLFLILDSLVTK